MLFHLILPTWSSQSYMKEIPKKDALPTGNYAKFQVPTVYSLIKQKNIFLKMKEWMWLSTCQLWLTQNDGCLQIFGCLISDSQVGGP